MNLPNSTNEATQHITPTQPQMVIANETLSPQHRWITPRIINEDTIQEPSVPQKVDWLANLVVA